MQFVTAALFEITKHALCFDSLSVKNLRNAYLLGMLKPTSSATQNIGGFNQQFS